MKYNFTEHIMNNLRFLKTSMCHLLLMIMHMCAVQLLRVRLKTLSQVFGTENIVLHFKIHGIA